MRHRLNATYGKISICILGILVLFIASGCSDDIADGPSGEYSPPAWFADEAIKQEEFISELQACVRSKGWNVTIENGNGAVSERFDGEEELLRYGADRDECLRILGYESESTEVVGRPALERQYDRKVDTADCLDAHGFQISDPPSKDAYVDDLMARYQDSGSGSPQEEGPSDWDPYYGQASIDQLTRDEVAALKKTCPEPWVFG